MSLTIRPVKALWGMPEPLPDALAKIEDAGYAAFSAPLDLVAEARAHGSTLPAVGMLFPVRGEEIEEGLSRAVDLNVEMVSVHAGKDWFTDDEADRFFDLALDAVARTGIETVFETHRGRLLYDPKSTARLLGKFPSLDLCADFSHWTTVCESWLDDQPEALDLAIRRTRLLHARVGHPEGPQVPDPRQEKWAFAVEKFDGWWDRVREAAIARGETVLRIDPEYGPPDYLWTDGDRPLADLWDVCLWQRHHLIARWKD